MVGEVDVGDQDLADGAGGAAALEEPAAVGADGAVGEAQQTDGDGQVEGEGFLLDVGGGEVDEQVLVG